MPNFKGLTLLLDKRHRNFRQILKMSQSLDTQTINSRTQVILNVHNPTIATIGGTTWARKNAELDDRHLVVKFGNRNFALPIIRNMFKCE